MSYSSFEVGVRIAELEQNVVSQCQTLEEILMRIFALTAYREDSPLVQGFVGSEIALKPTCGEFERSPGSVSWYFDLCYWTMAPHLVNLGLSYASSCSPAETRGYDFLAFSMSEETQSCHVLDGVFDLYYRSCCVLSVWSQLGPPSLSSHDTVESSLPCVRESFFVPGSDVCDVLSIDRAYGDDGDDVMSVRNGWSDALGLCCLRPGGGCDEKTSDGPQSPLFSQFEPDALNDQFLRRPSWQHVGDDMVRV